MVNETPEVDPLTVITVVGGEPSAEESAAAIAVVAGMLREGGTVDQAPPRDRWATTGGAVRGEFAGK